MFFVVKEKPTRCNWTYASWIKSMQVYFQICLVGRRTQGRNCVCKYSIYIFPIRYMSPSGTNNFFCSVFLSLFEKCEFAHRTQFWSLQLSTWVFGISISSFLPLSKLPRHPHGTGTRTIFFTTVKDLTVPVGTAPRKVSLAVKLGALMTLKRLSITF